MIEEFLSEMLGTEVKPFDNGYLIKETETHFVTVSPMIYNWRVCRTSWVHPEGPDRAWCYYGADFVTLLRAAGAALEWDMADDTSPEGYDKNAMTGEYATGGNANDPWGDNGD